MSVRIHISSLTKREECNQFHEDKLDYDCDYSLVNSLFRDSILIAAMEEKASPSTINALNLTEDEVKYLSTVSYMNNHVWKTLQSYLTCMNDVIKDCACVDECGDYIMGCGLGIGMFILVIANKGFIEESDYNSLIKQFRKIFSKLKECADYVIANGDRTHASCTQLRTLFCHDLSVQ